MKNVYKEVQDKERILTDLIKKYSAVSNINPDADLEWDLGLTGDDAFEFLTEYSKTFAVDVSKFPFHDFFHDEGQNFILIVNRFFRKIRKEKITLQTLLFGIEKGVLT